MAAARCGMDASPSTWAFAGRTLPHGTLLAKVWGREYLDEVDYLRVYVRRLRDKLGDDPEKPRYIRTERGLGYRFLRPN